MPQLSFQKPTDQPTGKNRLLGSLRQLFADPDLTECYMVVAFAKVGPLLRLRDEIVAWGRANKKIRAIIGVDEQGTSTDALQFAIDYFTEAYVAHHSGAFSPTFHPKLYAFVGQKKATAFIGSNNLTVGGTESNFEMNLRIDLQLPAEAALWAEIVGSYHDAIKAALRLDRPLLTQLEGCGLVLSETAIRSRRKKATTTTGTPPTTPAPVFPSIQFSPPSAIPRKPVPTNTPPTGPAVGAPTTLLAVAAQAFVIQIVLPATSELRLSKNAVDQNPLFFGWPFLGSTTPKKAKNPAYPQRVPDPVVDLRVFDKASKEVERHPAWHLNLVYYTKKSEIRITFPKLRTTVPDNSILVMRESTRCDYEMEIYVPGSVDYQQYLSRCNQNMPSGGKANPRRFGWI